MEQARNFQTKIRKMLLSCFDFEGMEAGCDEAGRGCLAGPVFAAAVIWPREKDKEALIKDSKLLTAAQRLEARAIIEKSAVAWAVAQVSAREIDQINILNASYLAMHRAIDQLLTPPDLLLVDGNRFKAYKTIPHRCIVKGDRKYMSIAAASILAKTYRDEHMATLCKAFPAYEWSKNKGYPTKSHRAAIRQHGPSSYHRQSFKLI